MEDQPISLDSLIRSSFGSSHLDLERVVIALLLAFIFEVEAVDF